MSKKKIQSLVFAGVLALLAVAAVAQAEIAQKGDLRVKFEGQLTPHSLPRSTQAPVKVSVSAKITPVGNAELPQLRTMSIAINRFGNINTKGLPVCELNDIQPATTADALAVCRKSLVGEGSFTADVPSSGRGALPIRGQALRLQRRRRRQAGDPRPRLRRAAGADLVHAGLPDLESAGDLRQHASSRPAELEGRGRDHGDLARRSSKTFKSHGKTQSYVTGSLPGAEGRQGRRLPLRESLPRVLGRAQGQLDAEPQLLRAGQVTPGGRNSGSERGVRAVYWS